MDNQNNHLNSSTNPLKPIEEDLRTLARAILIRKDPVRMKQANPDDLRVLTLAREIERDPERFKRVKTLAREKLNEAKINQAGSQRDLTDEEVEDKETSPPTITDVLNKDKRRGSIKSPAFQFYVNDWLGSPKIMLMTPAEEGAYIRLLAIAWGSDDCGLPNDDKELAILSRLGEGWFNGASTKIRKCFIEKGTRLYNKRLVQERKKQEIWRKKSREGGIKSGRLRKNSKLDPERWLNHPSTKKGRVVEPGLNPSSSFSSSSSNKERIIRKKVPDDEWINELQKKDCYSHLNVKQELQKCITYFEVKGIAVSRQRFLNWLNNPKFNSRPMEIKNAKSW